MAQDRFQIIRARANLGHLRAVGWQHAADQWYKIGFKRRARANLGHLRAVGWQHAAGEWHKIGFTWLHIIRARANLGHLRAAGWQHAADR